jgi:hypothetical protein
MNKKYTIMIVPDETTKVRRYHVPKPLVKGLLVVAALMVVGAGYMLANYYNIKQMVGDTSIPNSG